MNEIVMPRQGLAMDEATVVEWYFEPGEWVNASDAVLQAEGEKSTFEVQAHIAGYLEEILVPEGETVPIGTALGRVRTVDEGS